MAKPVAYHLPSDCSIAKVEALRCALENLVTEASAVDLHGENVSKIDAVGVQLLLAFVAALNAQASPWQWSGASARLRAAAQLLGLTQQLKLT